MNRKTMFHAAWIVFLVCAAHALAQADTRGPDSPLPDAPRSHLALLGKAQGSGAAPAPDQALASGAASSPADIAQRLTRSDAEQMALRNNPRISASRLLALAEHQVVRESRAALLPTANASLTAVDAENASRISAGSLTSSRLFEHAGVGGNFTQLISDFGRTNNLIASSKLAEKAQNANALATREDILVATDQAFYNALEAQAMYQVAKQNVDTRQATDTQVGELTKNKLKSTLDLSFADVNVSQAKLLLLDAGNTRAAAMAALDAVLGLEHEVSYELVDDTPNPQAPPPDLDRLVELGLAQRPDLASLRYDQEAAIKYSHAERDQMRPSLTASGTVGSVPIRPAPYYVTNWWGGIGVNLNIPVFNGFLYSAEAKEAALRAQAESEKTRDLRDQIVRDIHTAWLAANTAYQRIEVTQAMLDQANLSLKLAQARYQIGLSSIVELSQAQYQQTDAAIGNTNAAYQYRVALATLNYQVGNTP